MTLPEGIDLAEFWAMWIGIGGTLTIIPIGPAVGLAIAQEMKIGDGPLAVALMLGSGFVISAIIVSIMLIQEIRLQHRRD